MPYRESFSNLSRGTNSLLRLGATPVTSVDDVLAAVGAPRAAPVERAPLEPRLETVRAAVADAPAAADEVVRRTGLAPGAAAAALAELELLGLIVHAEGLYREVVPSS